MWNYMLHHEYPPPSSLLLIQWDWIYMELERADRRVDNVMIEYQPDVIDDIDVEFLAKTTMNIGGCSIKLRPLVSE